MKRNSIISMEKLSEDLLLSFKETYPYGFSDHVQKVVKPSGETMYVVRFETDDAVYAVKVNPFRNLKKEDDDLPNGMEEDYDNNDDSLEESEADASYEMEDLD